MRSTTQNFFHTLNSVAMATALTVTAVGAASVAARAPKPAAHLGDILNFSAARIVSLQSRSRLLVHRVHQFGCVLDLQTLRQGGGSLVVETQPSRHGSNTYRLHWAGRQTSNDPADCGADADLIVDADDVAVLTASAGNAASVETNSFFEK